MSDNFESAVESSRRTVSTLGARAKEKLMEQVRQEPTRTFAIILAGSVLTAVLVGYYISRAEDKTRRKRLVEDSMQEVANWIKQQSRSIAAPIKEGLEATKSAVEEVSNSSARVGRQLHPIFEKQKRSFLNLF
jgi:type II secretory pathway component PulM